ncbi:hypothetical protein DFJ74DRAFT_692996 [Hyaloraphidium curvatum]|nr:hypothetical protein DFJ74DRAFT_692996 [Hyaloraphidium curvatum]
MPSARSSRARLPAVAAVSALALLAAAVPARARDLPSTIKSPFASQGNCVGVYSTRFEDSSELKNVTEWNGNPACAEWITEYPQAPAFITPLGSGAQKVLQMNLVKSPYLNEFGRPFGRESAVSWSRWWQYGSVCFTMKTARGGGVVSAGIIDSYTPGANPDDEIDVEFVGKNLEEMQTTYFSINDLDFSHGEFFPTTNTYENFHNICVARTPQKIEWWLDGSVKRTLLASSVPGKFPYRSSKFVFTIWDGGQGAQGVAEWAGGPTDWSQPVNPNYRIQVDSVQIRCEDENGKWENRPVGQGQTCSTTTTSTTTVATSTTRTTTSRTETQTGSQTGSRTTEPPTATTSTTTAVTTVPPLETAVLFRTGSTAPAYLNCNAIRCSTTGSEQPFVITCDPGSCNELLLRDITGRGCLSAAQGQADAKIVPCPDDECTSGSCLNGSRIRPSLHRRQSQAPADLLWRFPPNDPTKLQSLNTGFCLVPAGAGNAGMQACASSQGWTIYGADGPVPSFTTQAATTTNVPPFGAATGRKAGWAWAAAAGAGAAAAVLA